LAQDTGTAQNVTDTAPGGQGFTSVGRDSVGKDSVRKINVKKRSSFANSPLHDSSTGTSINATDSLSDSLRHDSTLISVRRPSAKSSKTVIHLMQGIKRNVPDRDILFFILLFLVFFLGLIRTSFPRYLEHIFSLSFQATFRQIQTKDQMAQNFFPAFMLNVLFVFCGGLFITLFAEFNQYTNLPFWQLFIYSTAVLLVVYIVKYLVISFTGWVFNAKDAAAEYRFVVFLINKLLGILIIPLLFLIAYAGDEIKYVAATIVICLAVFSLVIRYLVSLARIRKNLSITAFHFFIYLCAVEIMPLLVIYKVLFQQTSNR
jgi:hypothetical protein